MIKVGNKIPVGGYYNGKAVIAVYYSGVRHTIKQNN